MKVTTVKKTRGTVLFVALVLLGIMTAAIAAVVSGTQQELRATERTVTWKSALPVAEAGIEEALAHLNVNMSLTNDGWFFDPTNSVYRKQRALTNGYFKVEIFKGDPIEIRSRGYVKAPLNTNLLSRAILVTTRETKLAGIEAREEIDCGSDGILDSYDSGDPDHSTGGRYDAKKAKDNCRLASISTTSGIIDVAGRKVHGYVATGPGGTVTLASNGKVGTKAWIARPDTGGKIETGRGSADFHMEFPSINAPFTGGLTPLPGTIGTNSYEYVFANGDYMLSKLRLASSQKAVVTGKARLYVTDDFSMTASSAFIIENGGSIEIFVDCDVSIAGQGFINSTAKALSLSLYGLEGCKEIKLAGSADFVGLINAPNARVRFGGSSTYFGHTKCRSAQIDGNNAYHADEAYGTRIIRLLSWNEVK